LAILAALTAILAAEPKTRQKRRPQLGAIRPSSGLLAVA